MRLGRLSSVVLLMLLWVQPHWQLDGAQLIAPSWLKTLYGCSFALLLGHILADVAQLRLDPQALKIALPSFAVPFACGLACALCIALGVIGAQLLMRGVLAPLHIHDLALFLLLPWLALLAWGLPWLLAKWRPAWPVVGLPALLLSNAAVLGLALQQTSDDGTWPTMLLQGLLTGGGFWLALMVFADLRQRFTGRSELHVLVGVEAVVQQCARRFDAAVLVRRTEQHGHHATPVALRRRHQAPAGGGRADSEEQQRVEQQERDNACLVPAG